MEYAVSIGIVAVFIAVFLITRPKLRAAYFDVYDNDKFKLLSEEFIRSMPLPKEGGKTNIKQCISAIKRIQRKIKLKRYGTFFDKFVELSDDIKHVIKEDFTLLDELPSIDNEPRVVKIARFCLSHTDYVFDEERLKYILEVQNSFRTLSFSEIESMPAAFSCVLIEKLSYCFLQLETLAKIYVLAAKYVYNPLLLNDKYKKFCKSLPLNMYTIRCYSMISTKNFANHACF